MPFYNKWELTHARLMEFYQRVPRELIQEIILVDDCSTEDVTDGVKWWKNLDHHKIRYGKNKTNLGFGGAMNVGAKQAEGDVVVLFSNDVVIRGNFVSEIHACLAEDNKRLVGGEVIYYPGGWNEFDINGRRFVVPYANGWLLACTKKAWDEVGGFALEYGKFDYEDIDLSTKFQSLGYNVVGLNSRNVHHLGAATIKTLGVDRRNITEENRKIYIAKWADRLQSIFG